MHENRQRLPREVELLSKKERLTGALDQLEEKSRPFDHLPRTVSVSLSPTVRFREGNEVFGVYFAKRTDPEGRHRIVRIDAYREVEYLPGEKFITPYDGTMGYQIIEEDSTGEVVTESEEFLEFDEYARVTDLVEEMNKIFSDENFDTDTPIDSPPDSFKHFASLLLNSEAMKYEKASREFHGTMSELGGKTKAVKVDKSKYQNKHNIIVLRQTPWVTLKINRKDAEFRLQLVDGYSNGDWQDDYRIQRRNVGDRKTERSVFYGGDANSFWKGVFLDTFATSEEVTAALDLVKKINEATPSLKKTP